jgi:predicted Rossmann fold nucleotide-binding protein DprA/Smf involved in DNA uptake
VLVSDAGEVVELAAPIGEGLTAATSDLATDRVEAELDPVAYRVWSTVPVNRPATTERLALAAGVEGTDLTAALATLESAGLVVREAGCWRKPRAPRRPRERREAGVDVGPSA